MSVSRAAPPPTGVAELCVACVDYVRRSTGMDLDYTPDTLPFLDAYLDSVRGEKRTEILQLIAPAAGAYFGEVVRRAFECRWVAPPGDYGAWRVELVRVYLFFNPVGFAVEAILREDTEGLGAALVTHDEVLAELSERLAQTEPVRVEDYYRLTTRFEVIDQVVDYLLVRRIDTDPDQFDSAYYEARARLEAPPQA